MTRLQVTDLVTEIESPDGLLRPVDGVTFTVESGRTVGLVGESGCGKTMTGMSVMGLLPAGGRIASGSVRFGDTELTGMPAPGLRALRGSQIALVSQDPMTSLNPTRTIGAQLIETYRIHTDASRAVARTRATEVLALVGMPRPAERLDDFPHQLSGGMRQRVMIALGLLCEPKLLIADEPTTALDVSIQRQILELIDDIKQRLSMSVLLITHDLGVIAGYADEVAVMYAGRIVEQAPVKELFTHPRHRYTRALFASMPTLDLDDRHDLATIPGSPPRLTELPTGCPFAPRCAFATDECRTARPVLTGGAQRFACFHPAADDDPIELPEAVGTGHDGREQGRPLVEISDLHRRFPIARRTLRGPRPVVHAVNGVSLSIFESETLGIVGESGCGKTTIGRMLVGLDRPTSGAVRFVGERTGGARGARRDLQMMFQDSAAALDPRMAVGEVIAEPLVVQHIGTARERRETVLELLEAVNLPASAIDRYPHEFSGGQRQRIAIARVLALRPKLVVADEPVSALDVSVQAQILNLLRDLQRRLGLTYVVISHDLSLLKYLADRIAVMYLGHLVEIGTSSEVYDAPLHPYTAGLIEAIPLPDPELERAKGSAVLSGELPSAIDPPSGCPFRLRCPRATDLCVSTMPALTPVPGRHDVACHHPLVADGTADLLPITSTVRRTA